MLSDATEREYDAAVVSVVVFVVFSSGPPEASHHRIVIRVSAQSFWSIVPIGVSRRRSVVCRYTDSISEDAEGGGTGFVVVSPVNQRR